MNIKNNIAQQFFDEKKWQAHDFQLATWQAIAKGKNGLLNAPTGFGKTYALWFGVLQNYFDKPKTGLHCLWITPLRALSKEIEKATNNVSTQLNLDYTIGLRTGDTTLKERNKQKKKTPNAFITTPESMHLLLAQKGYAEAFKNLEFIIVDEWHELLGGKRGVQIELAISRLKAINPKLKIWGISATIGNIEQAMKVLLGANNEEGILIKSKLKKRIKINTVFPKILEKFAWGGHLGIQLLPQVIPLIEKSNTTLVFTNTRAQAEIWYQQILEQAPQLAGLIALHHGSLSDELRHWVENALHQNILKAVVCTSSLDLGVDFQPVDTVIQIGSPKGVARFLQRAGRSGHSPGMVSNIYFVPTHSLEIIEGAAVKLAIAENKIESRIPNVRSFDVLLQYLCTLAVSDGFEASKIFNEIKQTNCFESINEEEFNWCLNFITKGGESLNGYSEFHKVIIENGIYKITNKGISMRHRMSIGTIVSDTMIQIKYFGGKYIGTVEEWFVSRLKPGDSFWFAGRNLELINIVHTQVLVKNSNAKNGTIPAYVGGRIPLSNQISESIRAQIDNFLSNKKIEIELKELAPLLQKQQEVSHLPNSKELLIEKINTKHGCHVFIYPFEGRNVHEGMAAIISNRIAQIKNITFSISLNDYGFELLSDQDIPLEEALEEDLFNTQNLYADAIKSMNTSEMANRKFRDIARIAGLVFNGYPGKPIKTKHLQANSQLFFKVFESQDKQNLLYKQAFDEVLYFQLELERMQMAFERIITQKIIYMQPKQLTPLSFPLVVEILREKFSNENIEDRINKMILQLEKA